MLEFLLVGEALEIIDKYFKEEASSSDFYEAPLEAYQDFEELRGEQAAKENLLFTVSSARLKKQYQTANADIFLVTEPEKKGILKAFALLRKYSENLPDNSTLNERLLIAKNFLPPVFFSSNRSEIPSNNKTAEIIAFRK